MKASQLGFSEMLLNLVGYIIHQDPSPVIYVVPNQTAGRKLSNSRIDPLLTGTPVLSEITGLENKKIKRVFYKSFPNGSLTVAPASTSSALKSDTAKFAFFDEADEYEVDVGGQGNPILLGMIRLSVFGKSSIAILVSTPTIKGSSIIEEQFLKTDQRKYFIPCPYCQEMQTLEFSQLKWTMGDYVDVRYECIACKKLIREASKREMFLRGEWRSTAKSLFKEEVGYFLSTLYSPYGWTSWGVLAKEFDDIRDNEFSAKVFYNTRLGQTYERKIIEQPKWSELFARRESYQIGTVPMKGTVLTMGMDVQENRVEYEVVAWCVGFESYSISYGVIHGSITSQNTKNQMSQLINKNYSHALGNGCGCRVRKVCIDSRYNSLEVMNWIRTQPQDIVVGITGNDGNGFDRPVGQPREMDLSHGGRRFKSNVKVFPIASNVFKSELYGWLNLTWSNKEDMGSNLFPPGFCHFPEYSEEYFKMLTAEKLTEEIDKKHGGRKLVWRKEYLRNEALDTRIYARAALTILGGDIWTHEEWNYLWGKIKSTGDDYIAPKKKRPMGYGLDHSWGKIEFNFNRGRVSEEENERW